MLQRRVKKGATTQCDFIRKGELLSNPVSSSLKSTASVAFQGWDETYKKMMKPLRVEGFEDFVAGSLSNFDANQIKTSKYKSTSVPFEVLKRIRPAAATPSYERMSPCPIG